MRFDQMLAHRHNISQPREPIEYPKYVKVEGKDVLALDAEHEAELLGVPDPEGEPSESDIDVANNLLSAPEKRKGGWPAGKPRKPVAVPSDIDRI